MMRLWARRADGAGGRHPGDEQLLELLLSPGSSDEDAGARREHAEACDACRHRLLALDAVLGGARASLEAEADAWFTDSRLDRQRAAVM